MKNEDNYSKCRLLQFMSSVEQLASWCCSFFSFVHDCDTKSSVFDNFTMLVGISDLIPKTPIAIAAGTIQIFLTRHTIVVEYYSFTLIVHVSTGASVRLLYVCPYFLFRTRTWININGCSLNLVYVFILWRSGLGLLMGKFRQFLTNLSARQTIVSVL